MTTIATRLRTLERTTRTATGPYHKESPPPAWWQAFEQAYHDWQTDRAARLAAVDLRMLTNGAPP